MTYRERTGIAFIPADAKLGLNLIKRADSAGVSTAWTVMPALGRDTMTLLAAAAVQTTNVKLGTAIVPAFTRHPLALATQAMTIEDLAPGRLRLGIGTSHQRTMIPNYGFAFDDPLGQLREYLQILRTVLLTGEVSFKGNHYNVEAKLPYASKTPVLISALRENAFELAGELSDGAITWLCPIEYLVQTAKPALKRGASKAGHATPPLIVHALVSPRTDRDEVRKLARAALFYYCAATFYQRMFAAAGYPLGPDNSLSDELLDAIVVSGSDSEIQDQLRRRLDGGMDELLVSLVASDTPADDEDALIRIVSGL